MYKYYLISFKNMNTGELKEYYQFISSEDIEERARELRNKFFSKNDVIMIYIYQLVNKIEDCN